MFQQMFISWWKDTSKLELLDKHQLLDKHASEKIKIVRNRENQHWYTEHIRGGQLQRRKLEWRCKKHLYQNQVL